MKRGEIWTLAGGGDYTRKPRPVVILRDDHFDTLQSITICPFTTSSVGAPLFRIPVVPTEQNGLEAMSRIMVDKITTVRKVRLGTLVGRLDDEDVIRLNRAMLVFLGLTTSPRRATASESASE